MKRPLRTFTIACTTFLTLSVSMAQPDDRSLPDDRLQEIKAQKSAYLTTKLALTPEEAQRFWPLYNAFDEQQDALRAEQRAMMREVQDRGASMTEAQAAELIEKNLENRRKELELEREYAGKFQKSIGAIKTVRLHRAERDFNREVLRRLKERMEDRKTGNGPKRR